MLTWSVIAAKHTSIPPQQLYYHRLHTTWEYPHAEQVTRLDTSSVTHTHKYRPPPCLGVGGGGGEMHISSGSSPRHGTLCQLMSHMTTPLIGAWRLWCKWGAEIIDKKEERRIWHFRGGQEAHRPLSPPSHGVSQSGRRSQNLVSLTKALRLNKAQVVVGLVSVIIAL